MHLIHLYHNFTRSVRTGDLDLYISCLPEITNIFFAMNHLNCVRWLVKYNGSLIKFPDTRFRGVFRLPKWMVWNQANCKIFLSSTPMDQSLEQTINADGFSQRFGITSMTNSISGRQLSAESHFFRTTIRWTTLTCVAVSPTWSYGE